VNADPEETLFYKRYLLWERTTRDDHDITWDRDYSDETPMVNYSACFGHFTVLI